MRLAPGLESQSTAAAISSARPSRPIGWFATASGTLSSPLAIMSVTMGVSMVPGQYGATDIVTERGDAGVAKIKELTNGLGAHSVIEAVGTQESMMQAIRSTREGGHVGFVGVAHDVQLPGEEMFYSHVHLHGGPAPVRRFLPELIDLIWNRKINPGKARSSTWNCLSSRPPRVTGRWMSGERSRSSFAPDPHLDDNPELSNERNR
jgi:Zinc-binding dehydrogenase